MVKGRPLPQAFLEKLQRIIPVNQWNKVSRSFASPKPTTFRVNSLKTNGPTIKQKLESNGFKIENVIWYKDAFLLRKGAQKDLEKTDVYKKGQIYVQGLSSMIPPLVLDPKPEDKVLDLTAAPGSKTTQLSCLMNNQGQITANDENPIRLEKMKANLDLQEALNVTLLEPGDGGLVWKTHWESFDRVLLDAPCSSEGRFELESPSTFGYWKKDTNRRMAKLQRRLFKSAVLALKPGGTLVYSTCTFAPEENEMVLNWALETYGDALSIEDISTPLPLHTRGLGAWDNVPFPPSIPKSARILPTADVEGFFVAKLKKTKAVPPPVNEWA
ncbi:MAG TPA: RsmB/NOP family class I SAM-dependent RNA methyltransferase [bacterium]